MKWSLRPHSPLDAQIRFMNCGFQLCPSIFTFYSWSSSNYLWLGRYSTSNFTNIARCFLLSMERIYWLSLLFCVETRWTSLIRHNWLTTWSSLNHYNISLEILTPLSYIDKMNLVDMHNHGPKLQVQRDLSSTEVCCTDEELPQRCKHGRGKDRD